MEHTLLVCKSTVQDVFLKENYCGSDDVFILVEKGGFVFDSGAGEIKVGPLEGANFRKGVPYFRRLTERSRLFLFRYRSSGPLFTSDHVRFKDKERVASTLSLIARAETDVLGNDFEHKRVLFADIVNQYALENALTEEKLALTDVLVSDAVTYIRAFLHRKLDLRAFAKDRYISYTQFARRFKSAIGMTVSDYIAALRMKKAETMLEETDLSVREIARECGFSNEYYFSAFFRTRHAVPPGEYRASERLRR